MRRRAEAAHPPRAGVGADLIIAIAEHFAQQIEMTRAEQDIRVHRQSQRAQMIGMDVIAVDARIGLQGHVVGPIERRGIDEIPQ